MIKRIISILGVFVISLALVGCQYFQKPVETTTPTEDSTAETTATVTIDEADVDAISTTGTLTIEGEDETASTTGKLEIEEGDDEVMEEDKMEEV